MPNPIFMKILIHMFKINIKNIEPRQSFFHIRIRDMEAGFNGSMNAQCPALPENFRDKFRLVQGLTTAYCYSAS
ncbi:MAG: hypothetical protein BWX92_03929 [Deltaproteobacteria bacterium ADurb.Bin135]|nr:MAG: hypothetical protein BWX92_03929 [Deltaproteobacteria bacterium ADurb.Bin135]